MNLLIVNGHKYYPYSQGRLNMTLFNEIVSLLEQKHNLQTTIVENGYIIEEEIQKYQNADVIIYQTPVNWFSVPWSLKKYYDEVFMHGIFYGSSEIYGAGGMFNEKKYMYSLTWNSPEEAFFCGKFYDGRSVDDILIALHKLHEYCGMKKIRTFSLHDVVKHPDIPEYVKKLKEHLNKYINHHQTQA